VRQWSEDTVLSVAPEPDASYKSIVNDLIYSSAVQLGNAIGNKQVSSVEVTEAHLRRIKEVNPKLNAVFHLAEESALKMARNADEELARGNRQSPLHGVPFTVKDWIEVERHLYYWDRFRRSLIAYMERYDFILTPVSDFPARLPGSQGGVSYCLPYSLAGYPCVVVRAGTSADGLPIGVQIVARPWREDVALGIAKHVEAQFGGWQPPPI